MRPTMKQIAEEIAKRMTKYPRLTKPIVFNEKGKPKINFGFVTY